MTAPLRVAVVGAGGWGEQHARIFAGRPDTELVAIVGRTPDRVARRAAAYGTTAYTDIEQMLADMNANIKVLAAPPVAPPGPSMGQSAPPPDEGAVFSGAVRDQTGGKLDLAIQEFQDFIKFYPDNPNAARAQYNIGENHYTQQKFDIAAQDFDTVITHYPVDADLTPRAYFMKGMALKNTNRTAAIAAWRKVYTSFPTSDAAAQAKEQLHAIGAPLTAPTATVKRKPGH